MKQPVYHFKSGNEAWRVGFLGFITSLYGSIFTAILFTVSVYFLINDFLSFDFNNYYIKYILIALLGVQPTILLTYLKYRTKRSLNIKNNLHQLTHDIRDGQTELYQKISKNEDYTYTITKILENICNNVANHFEILTRDKTIGTSIRLANSSKDKAGNCVILYKTYARSKKFSKGRENTSETININFGIPRFLYKKKDHGVLIYKDIEKATELGVYTKTKNDISYKEDIKSMIVMPLNAFAGKDKDMIGIMYITSKKKKTFKVIHTDSALFIADLTANVISNIIEYINLNNKTTNNLKNNKHVNIIKRCQY